MNDTNGDVFLRVPRETAEKLETKAKKKGISGRAAWSVYARILLNQAAAEAEA
jgi:hypothetical protein